MNKNIQEWTGPCIGCQKSKIQRHTQTPFQKFERIKILNPVLIGPLHLLKGFSCCFTLIRRCACWTEGIPLSDIRAEAIAEIFYSQWIARFGIPKKSSRTKTNSSSVHYFTFYLP